MDFIQIFILSIVQGFTEFLPISSSAHLILIPEIFHYSDQGFAFDIAVHLGSLFAVMIYFRQDIAKITIDLGIYTFCSNHPKTAHSTLGMNILIATLPIIVFGLMFKHIAETELRTTWVIASSSIVFAILLLWADKTSTQTQNNTQISWKSALFIGFFQVLAIIPGTSRSGITITAALLLGLSRDAAARFSFLLSIPTIFMSVSLVIYELIQSNTQVNWSDLALGTLLSFIAAYICITLFLKIINRIGMLPFVIYRIILGLLLFTLLYLGY